LQSRELRLGQLADLGVGVAGQLLVLRDAGAGVLPGAIGGDQLAQARELLGQLAQLPRIAGELGLAELVLELLIPSLDFSDALEHGSSARDRLATTDPRGRGEGCGFSALLLVAAPEPVHLSGGVHDLLLAREEGMAVRTTYANRSLWARMNCSAGAGRIISYWGGYPVSWDRR
jgi:hypothetical protein